MKATHAQVAACRAVLASAAARVTGAVVFAKDEIRVAGEPVARRLGHTILVPEVWAGSARAACSVTFFAHESVENIVAAISARVAIRARWAAVSESEVAA